MHAFTIPNITSTANYRKNYNIPLPLLQTTERTTTYRNRYCKLQKELQHTVTVTANYRKNYNIP